MTVFREALTNWWTSRIDALKAGEKLSPLTIRGILYLLRKIVGIDNMPGRSGFYAALDKVEQEHGVTRQELAIVTEPKINLVTRFDEKPMLKAKEWEIRDVCALLYIEKSTIIAAIEEDMSLTDRGISIVKAMGFSTRDVNKVIKLAQGLGVPILTLTDYDPSGVLIDLKIEATGVKTARVGVDVELVKVLDIPIEDVRERLPRDPRKLTHWKHLQKEYPEIADVFLNVIGDGRDPYRIEIDGVFAFAGKDKFIEAILERADRVVPVKPLQKALLFLEVPERVNKLRWAIYYMLDKVFAKVVAEELEPYVDLEKPFREIRLSEIETEIEEAIDTWAESGPVLKILEDAIVEIDRLLKEQS